jgi:hypothetical protein
MRGQTFVQCDGDGDGDGGGGGTGTGIIGPHYFYCTGLGLTPSKGMTFAGTVPETIFAFLKIFACLA